MKNHIYLVICLFFFLISGCEKDKSDNRNKLSVAEANDLTTAWIFEEYNPEMNPSAQFSLTEYTTNEIWDLMSSQIFLVESDPQGTPQMIVLIKDSIVYDLNCSITYGTLDFDNMFVTDLDNNGIFELSYIIVAGSGVLFTSIVNFSIENKEAKAAFLMTSDFINHSYSLERENINTLYLYITVEGTREFVGQLKLSHTEDGDILYVE